MHVVRHDAPVDQLVFLPMPTDQLGLQDFGTFWQRENGLPMTRILITGDPTMKFF
jgi:hypothetical protein